MNRTVSIVLMAALSITVVSCGTVQRLCEDAPEECQALCAALVDLGAAACTAACIAQGYPEDGCQAACSGGDNG